MDYAVYITKPNDRLDLIAGLYYGNCFNVQPIYDANPHLKSTPVIKEGVTLLIPLLSKAASEGIRKGLPLWKQS